MAWIQGTGGARPSRPMSWLTAVVGVGMLVTVTLFAFATGVGVAAFLALWVLVVVSIVGYHIRNATSDRGVPHTQVDFTAHHDAPPAADFADRLRELEKLRQDGLITEDEYQRKRDEIMQARW